MNPSPPPYPNLRSFTFATQNPNPNPNHNSSPDSFSHSLSHNQHPSTSSNPPVLDVHSTLSSLKDLISLSHQTLAALSKLFSPSSRTSNCNSLHTITKNADLVACPFNPHHYLPPESLFVHSLRCPSSLDIDSLLQSLNYPKTVESSSNLQRGNRFVQSLKDPNAELCFSLDEYIDFGSNFFYKNCPGVVELSDLDGAKRTFTLPGILSVECANFVVNDNGRREIKNFENEGFRVLPSDLLAVRHEIETWTDCPPTYSYTVLCVILGLKVIEESDLKRWLILNSPRFGVVIDVHMRDHIFVLLRLCLKGVTTEAFGLAETVVSIDVKEQTSEVSSKSMSFECPVLVQVLTWLASQLSVLYGEINGKFFAINFLKYCISEAASSLLFFPMNTRKSSMSVEVPYSLEPIGRDIRSVKPEEPLEVCAEYEQSKMITRTIGKAEIFVSQVAAAVAALHERSWLEEKINGLRISQPLNRYQRMAEHAYVSKRADDERKRRPNFKPIIEHDGLPRQPSNQETSKIKTREELLAEERDYKRRRLSYRGKKLKRTTLQVMRDIIEEYMEEIKQAGGIGCFVKEAEGAKTLSSMPSSVNYGSMDVDEVGKGNSDSYETTRGSRNLYRQQTNYDYYDRSSMYEDSSQNSYERQRRGLQGHHGNLEDQRSIPRDKHGGDYYSRSVEKHRNGQTSHDWNNNRREQDAESTQTKYHETERPSSNLSNYRDYRSSYSASRFENDFGARQDHKKSEIKDKYRRSSNENHGSGYLLQDTFEDRYNPRDA